jgi:hypothetical protein
MSKHRWRGPVAQGVESGCGRPHGVDTARDTGQENRAMIKPSMKTKPDGRRWWIAFDAATGKQTTRWPLAYGRWSTRTACARAILTAEKRIRQ